MLLLDRPASEVLHTSLTLAEYLSLPELEPELEVHTHRLAGAVYEVGGVFGRGTRLTDPELPWLDIEVDTLLGDFA